MARLIIELSILILKYGWVILDYYLKKAALKKPQKEATLKQRIQKVNEQKRSREKVSEVA